ncbi:bacterio-opsin activator domain-containing protein [Haloarchaeobius sp. TZWSO28]|uniref:bacterio-opsin activator domain-containing protein n=1 Tax=Haloarchaeobius sp. TZWSO28 TaxID=3446119 RepID=UPI003EBFC25E
MDSETRVLLVDGDDGRVGETADVLVTEGFAVDVVADADEALSAMGRALPHCVVCEFDVGDVTGVELLRTVRAVHGGVPFVLCTADGSEAIAERAVAAEVDGYVRREGSDWQERLLERVREAQAVQPTDHQLKERALDEAPVGITIADANAPDMPLIYTNDAFERLTGYDREDVIGRNCRFLQGEDSDPDAVRQMREAIENEEPVSVELVNYTKTGERFWNKVDIAPIRDETGEVSHFVGFQTDVTDRVQAERTAEQRAAQLAAEREGLEHLLERIDGLIQETMGALVEATSRNEIETNMCELLAETDPFTCAWTGEPDLADNTVRPNAIVGGSAEGDAMVLDGSGGVVEQAVETGEVQVVAAADLADREWHEARADEPFSTVAVIPLVYRDARYGVLTVYTDDPAALDEREATILAALGRMVATAISAAETRRTLTADNIVQLSFTVTDRSVFFVDVAERANATLTYAGSVYRDDDSLGMFFTVEAEDPDEVADIASESDTVLDTKIITRNEGMSLIEFTVANEGLLSTLAAYGADVKAITAKPGTASVEVELPRDANARTIVETIEAKFDGIDLTAYRERERPATTKQEFIAALEDQLTERQLTALQRAYFGDFFEWPRPTSGDDLADSMGIARSTYHQHLRAAERKLVGEFFDRP